MEPAVADDPFADLAPQKQAADPFAELAQPTPASIKAKMAANPKISPYSLRLHSRILDRNAAAQQAASAPPITPVNTPAQADVSRVGPGPANPDVSANALPGPVARITKNLIDPMLENPISALASSAVLPVGIGIAAKSVAENVGGYAGQKAAELTLPTDVRKMAEADPERIQGADVATQLAGLAAAPLLHAGAKAVIPDIGKAVPGAFSDLAHEMKGTPPLDPEIKSELFAQRQAAGRAAIEGRTEAQKTDAFADLIQPPKPAEVKAIAKTPPVAGLQTPETSVQDIASEKVAEQVAEQAKAEAAAADAAKQAEAKATADYQAKVGTRTAKGVEAGIVRRPGGVAAPPPEPFADLAPPVEPPAEPTPPAAPPAVSEPIPSYPEGFTMGGTEGRIPKLGKLQTIRGNPDVPGVAATSDVAAQLTGDEPPPLRARVAAYDFGANAERPAGGVNLPPLPEGTPKGTAAADLVNPRTTYAGRNAAVFDAEMARVSAKGLDKGYVPFSEQTKVANALADAIGVDRLSVDPQLTKRLSGPEIVARKIALSRNMDAMAAASKELAEGGVSAERAGELNSMMDRIRAQNDDLLTGIVKGSEQAGRDLGFLRQLASHSLDPDMWEIQAKRLAGDKMLTDDQIADIRKAANDAARICGE